MMFACVQGIVMMHGLKYTAWRTARLSDTQAWYIILYSLKKMK